MQNISSSLKIGLLAAGAIVAIASCSKDDSLAGNGRINLSAKSTVSSTSAKAAITSKSLNSDIVITDFRMNLKEFELEMDSDHEGDDVQGEDNELWNDDGFFDFEDEIELEGPFELDLLSGQISFISVDVPNGVYEELEFKFDKSTDDTSELFGKSILIQGTLSETAFTFWHDFEDEVEVDFEDPQFDITVQNNVDELLIDFDLTVVFNATTGVDLSQATDDNGDGLIEISPTDTDGNNALAQSIRDSIKAAIDLLDD